MTVASAKWLRRLLLFSIYGLGVIGIVGSGGGGGSSGDCEGFNATVDCVVIPPLPSSGTVSFNARVTSIAPALDSSDDVYVGGLFTIYRNSAAKGIARLDSNGSLDTGFMTGTGFNRPVSIIAPAVDSIGDVYVGGAFTDYNGSAANSIVRLNLDGTIDTDFDTGTGFDAPVNIIAPAVDSSGDVYVGGEFTTYKGMMVGSGLVRLRDDGSLDTGFNASPGWGEDVVVPATDGSGVYVTRDSSPYIARLDDNGSVDAGFDTGLSGFNAVVRSIAVSNEAGGDVYAAGFFSDYNGTTVNGLVRLDSGGSLDMGFVTYAGFVGRGNFITPAIDSTGAIYVDIGNRSGVIVRLDANGSFDSGFDPLLDFRDNPDAVAIAIDGSNDVLVGAGSLLTNSNMVRLNPMGR